MADLSNDNSSHVAKRSLVAASIVSKGENTAVPSLTRVTRRACWGSGYPPFAAPGSLWERVEACIVPLKRG
jgi:hypothetical protein